MNGAPDTPPPPGSEEQAARLLSLSALFNGRKAGRRFRIGLNRPSVIAGTCGLVLAASLLTLFLSQDDKPPPRRVHEFTIVNVVPPPPPPPPPPPAQQPPPEQEMVKQPEMVEPEIREEAKVEEPNEAPPDPNDAPPESPLGPGLELPVSPGASPYAAGPGGRGGGGGGSRWGWYASIVQQQIESALRSNAKTRNAVMRVQLRLWADSTGRVTRIQLVSSTGDPEVDAAIRNEALAGLMLREPPPKDMPMPLVARITARRPG